MPHKSRFRDMEFPVVDIWTMYMDSPRQYPDDHPLLISGETGRTYSFAQLRSLSIAFGQGLKHVFRWSKGDVLAFFSPNDIDTCVLNLGVHWAGGVASPVNPTYTADELAQQLKDSGAKAVVTQKAFLQPVCRAAHAVGLPLENVLLMGEEVDDEGRFRHWKGVTAKGAWIAPKKTPVDPKCDLAYLAYSSGTTGPPKGVMLTHYNMVVGSFQNRKLDVKGMSWDVDAQIGVLPFFHIYGLAVVLNASLFSGASCVTMAKFDLDRLCQLVQRYKVTFLYVPPPIVLALGKSPVVSKYDLSSLRWINSAAAPLSRELVETVWKRLKIGVKQGYGLTETSPTVASQHADEWWKFQGSVGRLLPNVEAKVVDAQGNEVPTGETGELLLKGPNVFQGYWKRPELNKDIFTDDGWYRTGDVFYISDNGNLYITDRIKELIKYKGFQVPPAELEAKVIGHKDVADVCVVGVWNEQEHTEVPRAYVKVSDTASESDELAQEIVDWLNAKVGPPKRLRGGVRFVKEIPKSASGKILRRVLKEQVKREERSSGAKL